MNATLLFPGRYVQGRQALQTLSDEVERLGGPAFLLCDEFAASRLGETLRSVFAGSGGVAGLQTLTGANSESLARYHAGLLGESGAKLIVGVGGGKVIDAAKAAAEEAGCPLIVVPTAASTDAPCSSVSVMQHEDGRFSHYRFLRSGPACVLVDTGVIAAAPPRMLVAGIGDALSTWFEAEEASLQGWANVAGTRPSGFALAVARECFETVTAHALPALQELREDKTGESFERIVEANILLSGIGFESGGLGTAHAIQNGLATLPQCRGVLHGELVNIGLLAMLRLGKTGPGLFAQVRDLGAALGLPVRLADIGLEGAPVELLHEAASFSCTPAPMNRVASGIQPEDIVAALMAL